MLSFARAVAVLIPFASTAAAQSHWLSRVDPAFRHLHAAVFDEGRQRLVVFGGMVRPYLTPLLRTDTAEWDGVRWQPWPESAALPLSDTGVQGVYDSARGVLVAMGRDVSGVRALWHVESAVPGTWTRRVVSLPPFVTFHIAFDRVRARTVLHGSSGFGSETWEFDGSSWSMRASLPNAMFLESAMAYDQARQRTVLWMPAETREWDGVSWAAPVAGGPPVRRFVDLAYVPWRQRLWLSGGSNGVSGAPSADVHEWTGTGWIATTPLPSARAGHAAVGDPTRNRLLLVAGIAGTTTLSDLQEATSAGWVSIDQVSWPRRDLHGFVVDPVRGRTVLFGGRDGTAVADDATWLCEGLRWQRAQLSPAPSPRMMPAMGFDAGRQRTVLFGGYDPVFNPLSDSWEWDGTAWSQLSTATIPAPGAYPALAYDAARQRLVLDGGDATYEFDGLDWQLRAAGPARWRVLATMVYDQRARRVLRFIATLGIGLEVQAWDGSQWSVQPTSGARPTVILPMSVTVGFDEARQRTVWLPLSTGVPADTWEWDGSNWRLVAQRPPSVSSEWAPPLVSIADRGLQLFGGASPDPGVWSYRSDRPATAVPYGAGCGVPPPVLQASGLPWLGDVLQMSIEPRAQAASALLAVGASRTSWNGTPLPFDLGALGFVTCFLHAAPDVLLAMPGGNLALPLPNAVALVGAEVFQQGLAADAVGRVSVTAGLALRFGLR